MSTSACDEVRELAAELALGMAGGEERARAIEHAAGCAACRHELDSLANAADELLLLAPEREPPLGFETRVIDRLDAIAVPSARRVRPWARYMAIAAVAASIAAAAMSIGSQDDRRLAAEYRSTLAENDGSYFEAKRLRAPGGGSGGQVFGYQGSPSWLLVIVKPGRVPSGRYRAELVTQDGRRIALRSFSVGPGGASWGRSLPVRLDDIALIRVVGERPGATLQAGFEHEP